MYLRRPQPHHVGRLRRLPLPLWIRLGHGEHQTPREHLPQGRPGPEEGERRGQVPGVHPGGGEPGAEGLRLDPGADAGAGERLQQEQAARQETHERLHGVGAGGPQEAGGSIPASAQRRAQQDPGQALEAAEREREAPVRGGGRAAAGAAQEGPPRLQVPAPAEEVGEERAGGAGGGRGADPHLPQRHLQGAAGGLAAILLQHQRGALARGALGPVPGSPHAAHHPQDGPSAGQAGPEARGPRAGRGRPAAAAHRLPRRGHRRAQQRRHLQHRDLRRQRVRPVPATQRAPGPGHLHGHLRHQRRRRRLDVQAAAAAAAAAAGAERRAGPAAAAAAAKDAHQDGAAEPQPLQRAAAALPAAAAAAAAAAELQLLQPAALQLVLPQHQPRAVRVRRAPGLLGLLLQPRRAGQRALLHLQLHEPHAAPHVHPHRRHGGRALHPPDAQPAALGAARLHAAHPALREGRAPPKKAKERRESVERSQKCARKAARTSRLRLKLK